MTDRLGSFLRGVDRVFIPVENLLNFIAGLIVFFLMFLGVSQIVLRVAFDAPIFGYVDIVEVTMVGFAVLSISYVQRLGGHVRMEILISRLKGRANWMTEIIGTLVAMFIVGVLIPSSYNHFFRAYRFGDSTIDIELPTWPAKLIVPIALSVLQLRLFMQLLDYLRLAINSNLEPISVPKLKSVDEQAQDEIRDTETDPERKNIMTQKEGGR
tara:strand:- start:114 stop:749 length:636 start_codon:yes stop_codon:yes gene_type:complete